jgi:cytochrome c biogenesis protein CcdA
MLRLIGLAISIGIADSINPGTIAPALYLAHGEGGRRRVAEFTLAVFAVGILGGAAIALGPGRLLLSALPHPTHHTRYLLETIAGVVMLVGGLYLLRYRKTLAGKPLPEVNAEGRSSAWLGATITAIELPTAFPYFAVIAAVVGSGLGPARQLSLLMLFNLCFIGPLLGILGVLTFAPNRADQLLGSAREWLQDNWPMALAGLLLVAGLFVTLLGTTGLAGRRSRFVRFMRHFPRVLRSVK